MKKIEKDTLKFSGIDNLEMIQGVPQQGETGGTPATFKPNTAPEIKEMTVDDIISTIDGVPYYNDVVGVGGTTTLSGVGTVGGDI